MTRLCKKKKSYSGVVAEVWSPDTTWEEIERWSVNPRGVPEPFWESMEQCDE
jgi:hypothetical protein